MARNADPNAVIVRFFLTKPLAVAQQALSTAKSIVAERSRAQLEVSVAPAKRKRVRKKVAAVTMIPVVQQGASPGVAEAPAPTPAPVAAAAPAAPPKRTRNRPPLVPASAVVTPSNPTGAMPPLGTGTTTGAQ